MRRFILFCVVMLCCASVASAALDVEAIEKSAGVKGTWIEAEKVCKLTFPREDVKVVVDGTTMPAFMGLTSWASFMSGREKQVMMMGDVVLFADEVGPAMSAALENGLEVTALGNHFAGDEPRVCFMHIGGEGTGGDLASGVRKVMDSVRQVREKSPQPATSSGRTAPAEKSEISAAPLDEIFAAAGEARDGMYKIVFGREVSMPCACTAGKGMGVNTWAAFFGSDERAIVNGEFACTYVELQEVLKTLRRGGIDVVAITNHMDAEAPRLIFVHFQGSGKAVDLAKVIKAALDSQKQAPASADHAHHHH